MLLVNISKKGVEMELIKKLETRRNMKGRMCRWGLYKCPKCFSVTERQVGTQGKTCSYKCRSNAIKHGDARKSGQARLHSVWAGMKSRCNSPNDTAFKYYGGKGIQVCEQWKEYPRFKSWAMNNGYKDTLTIDRISSEGDYTPSNCRFITQGENTRRATRKLTIKDANNIRCLLGIDEVGRGSVAKMYGVGGSTIARIARGETYMGVSV